MTLVLDKNKRIHFMGVGGINMSSLAYCLISKGFKVSGSDMKASELTEDLALKGAKIFIGQRSENITDDIGLVVYTAAIRPDNPELLAAKSRNIPVMTRADFLGQLMKLYKEVICISGTHGKTTTTAMISEILLSEGKDPTIMIGGMMPEIGGNTRIGSGNVLVAEACEYTNSFLSFFPTHAAILNIRPDHLDFFKDIDDIRKSFKAFANLIPPAGTLVLNGEIDDPSYITEGLMCSVITYGLNENGEYDLTAKNITYDDHACAAYELFIHGVKRGRVILNVPGEHNVSNSLAALALAASLGCDIGRAVRALSEMKGVERRFEIKGEVKGVTIIDDYAHHPDEIRATLSAAKSFPHKKLWVVFQPHTYSRTLALMDEFADALKDADCAILTEIYAAREVNTTGLSSKTLSDKISALGRESYFFATFDETENFILENCEPGDVLITMGAGDVVKIGDNLLGL